MQYTEIDYSQTNILASSKKTKLYRSNQIIYKEKEKISNIFIILDGIVESSSSDQYKKNKFTLHKGSSLGLIDAILKRPFSRNMLAKTTVSLAIIEKDTLENILGNNEFSGVLIKSLVIDIDNKYPHVWS